MPQESTLADLQNDTCALVHAPERRTLQAIFDFPQYTANNTVTVDVLTKHVEDCSSPPWTWFTGSSCFSDIFRECASDTINENGIFSRCRVTCLCPNAESCRFLHLKYVFDQRTVNIGSVCEVKLVYGDVNVPFYGTGWTQIWLNAAFYWKSLDYSMMIEETVTSQWCFLIRWIFIFAFHFHMIFFPGWKGHKCNPPQLSTQITVLVTKL